jgi:hypothetical protein
MIQANASIFAKVKKVYVVNNSQQFLAKIFIMQNKSMTGYVSITQICEKFCSGNLPGGMHQ